MFDIDEEKFPPPKPEKAANIAKVVKGVLISCRANPKPKAGAMSKAVVSLDELDVLIIFYDPEVVPYLGERPGTVLPDFFSLEDDLLHRDVVSLGSLF